jgi:uncharacterized protein (DUF2336 family)
MQDFAAMTSGRMPGADNMPAGQGRRVGADAFRSLTARLRKDAPIPDITPAGPPPMAVPPPAATALAPPPAASAIPEFVARPVPPPLPSHSFKPLARPVFERPHFEPLAPPPAAPVHHQPARLPEPLHRHVPEPPPQVAREVPPEPPAPVVAPAVHPSVTTVPPPLETATSAPVGDLAFPSFPDFGAWPQLPELTAEETAPPPPPGEEALAPPHEEIAPAALEALVPEETLEPYEEPAPPAPEWEAAPAAPEPALEPVAELPPQPAHVEEVEAQAVLDPLPEPQGSLRGPVKLAPAPLPGGEKPGRATSPLADKIVEALVKTVTEAVYARPSAAERAAFLREVAELVERDEMAEGEAPAPAAAPVAAPRDIVAAPREEPAPEAPVTPGPGSRSSILRKPGADDPFSAGVQARLNPPKPSELPEADEDTGEVALSLLEMMSGGSATSQPQERALAADTLLRLVPKIPVRQLLAIAERVAMMEAPPPLLVAKLIRDPRPEIAAPLLERCAHISDHDLMLAATEGDVHKQRMLARRRVLSPVLSDQLIARGDGSVLLTLVRNPGATLNHEAFYRLAEHAFEHEALLAPLTTRADLPAPVAFELFWHVPQELRRFIFSRFLTDSENLNRILKITMATQLSGEGAAGTEMKFPSREAVDDAMSEFLRGALDTAAQRLGELATVAPETALRILSDREGEPLAVLMKALGYPRTRFGEALDQLQKGEVQAIRPDRKLEELQGIFDTLSFNKARILLTYWDWFICKSGPYAPHH